MPQLMPTTSCCATNQTGWSGSPLAPLPPGGFRELTLPIAKHLGIPKERVFANRMQWQVRAAGKGGGGKQGGVVAAVGKGQGAGGPRGLLECCVCMCMRVSKLLTCSPLPA
jgi:hypothetical protein